MNKLGIAIVGSSLLAPSLALAAPGDLLVTEAEGGSVLVFTEGGDLSEATRFATGLSNPTGICIGPGGDIYVSETNTGQITVLGDGGDLTDAEPYATGLVGMGSLWCDDERIIISCPACPSPGVVEIQTEGVIAQNATFFALNLPLTGDLFFDATGDLLVVAMDVYNIEVGGDLTGATPFTTGQTMLAGMDIGGTLLGAEFLGPRIFDVTAGGDLSDAAPWATLPALAEGEGVQAMLHSAVGDYVLNGEDIYLVPPGGGDLTGADPFATGLNTGVQGLQGMAYHVCGNNDDCADDDLCNGDELCVNNACEAPRGPPDCDDENVCTADSCDAIEGCVNAPVEGCCLIDLDCEVDELCDVSSNACVPTGVPPSDDGSDSSGSGASTDGGDDTDGGNGDADETPAGEDAGAGENGSTGGSGDSSGGDAGADDDAAGCSCRSGETSPPLVLWLGLLLARRRRTRLGS